ncbi:MAG: hypothetical protein JXM68_04130 [Sedimentisphaerales bacterium]|nr:hypothetical protein [Sedimentisphaerales bacterium]
MKIEKYSIGIGDRFTYQSQSQLQALKSAATMGIDIVPVWNKSYREHKTIGTSPDSTRRAADRAVADLGWSGSYYCDADHIGLVNVDHFVGACDYFTLDVADYLAQPAEHEQISDFINKHSELTGSVIIPGLEQPLTITTDGAAKIAGKILNAVRQAGKIYKHIASVKGADNFITEVSLDETDMPQSPVELLFILAALADEQVPVQAIAPKFSGRFNKGVDYVGDLKQFSREFEQDLAVLRWSKEQFGLPDTLKLSVHSGSDKFSLYGPIRNALLKFDAGLHLKTAGTTWLEEMIGLARAGGEGLKLAKEIYALALPRYKELCDPYASVLDIQCNKLPAISEVNIWQSQDYVNALCHEQSNPGYNPDFRQFIHVSYKVAAELGGQYTQALTDFQEFIAPGVTDNILNKHIIPVFPPSK